MQREFLLVANWKMQLTYKQSVTLARMYAHSFGEIPFVLCPSFESLSAIKHELAKTKIALGAQDVSAHTVGAYTGQVAATSLKEIGCSYCIVGHSERRRYNHEADTIVAQKVEQLLMAGITPIICVGETAEQRESGQTQEVVRSQLAPLLSILNQQSAASIYIAYEPIWAIGSGEQPAVEYVMSVIAAISAYVKASAGQWKMHVLYGGSVTADTMAEFKAIQGLGGLLIGGASIDFQKFKKIVSLRT